MFLGMRSTVLALIAALTFPACDSKKSGEPPAGSAAPATAQAPLTDLTASSSLEAVRAAFNAKKGEARFLTLLSPT